MMPESNDRPDAEVIPLRPAEAESEPAAEIEHQAAEVVEHEPADEPDPSTVVARPRWGFNTRVLDRIREDDGSPRVRPVVAAAAKSAGKATARHTYAVAVGHATWAKRATGAMTHGHVREQIRQARAAGDTVALAEWHERLQSAKAARTRTLRDLPRMVSGVVQVSGLVLLAGALMLIAGGLWAQFSPGGTDWFGWWSGLAAFGSATAWLLGWLVTLLVTVGPAAWLVAAWREGQRSEAPRWIAAPASAAEGSTIVTADGVTTALRHLAVPAMSKAFKDGWQPKFATTPVRDGDGFHTVVELPMGVTPGMVADKRDVLARNLHRAEVEVWPADSEEQRGYLDLWVANSGVLSKPAPDYPLLEAGTADVFTGVPVGVTQRGDALTLPLVEANVVVGGMPGQGKSNFGRVLMLGAALDPLAELRAYVFAGNGDFDAYAPRLSVYRRGADEDTVTAGVDSLRELYDEVARRETRLGELGAKKLTRGLADKHADLRPLVAFYSECHEMFGHREHGKEAADYAAAVVRRGRKAGVIAGFDTQSSRADAIPPKVVELVKINACFAVKTWRSNDGFLGDGSFASGVRATELRPGKDRGTALLTGATAERFELLKTYYIAADDESGWDAATDVIARAMEAVSAPTAGAAALAAAPESRDLLEDLDQVLGAESVPSADVPALLRELAPTWAPYRRMSGKSLRDELAGHGVKVPSTGNRYPLDPATIRAALAEQATRDLDE